MRTLLTLLSLALAAISLQAQTLYNESTIQTIEIVFSQDNWDEILDNEMAGDNNYTEASSVTINGTTFEQVGVKYKGNSSYNANQVKNPFHIELDTYVDQNYEGYTDIKLSNVIFDPSFVREAVSYHILREYMDAPQANFANVYVNGNLIGLYTNVESISKKFVNNYFGSSTNAFFNCSPPNGATPQSTYLPNLAYWANNTAAYEEAYEIKSDDDDDPGVAETHWNQLKELTNILSNDIDNIETVLDVDRALWMLAFDNIMVNIDSYIGQFKQNYYLYRNDDNHFNPIVWDLNMSFGTFNMTGSNNGGGPPPGGGGNLHTTTEKAELDHLLHDDDATNFPLVAKLLAVPRYKRMYLAHYKSILTEQITSGNYLSLANTFQTLIDASVQADNNKFYTYAQFLGNIDTDYSVGQLTAPGLSHLMTARSAYLSALSDFTNTQPSISDITLSNSNPQVGNSINITANIADANTAMLYYRTKAKASFSLLQMYDDGNHNDGAANDNVFGVELPITNALTHYYIYAENDNIGAYSPSQAAHVFYSIDATYSTIEAGDLVINEIMADNETTVADQDGEYDDWLELYNNSGETLSLDNLYLSDDPTDLLAWQFPDGTTIAPGSYLIVWCDKDEEQDGLHANLKFSSGGESAILSYADGTIIENITFGEQTTDMSYARNPNGTGDFVIQAPTFNGNNEYVSVEEYDDYANISIYPNPATSILQIESGSKSISEIKLYNNMGQLVMHKAGADENKLVLNISELSQGVYFLNIDNVISRKVIKQ